jgi:uroporphyrinogen decarboxylase
MDSTLSLKRSPHERDRIPVMEWIVHQNVIDGIHPGGTRLDFVADLDLDGIGASHRSSPINLKEEPPVFVDRWGVKWGKSAEAYTPIEGPIKSESDLDRFVPPDPTDDVLMIEVKESVERFKGEKFIFFTSGVEFQAASNLRGLANLLMDFVNNPEFAHAIFSMVAEYHYVQLQQALDNGADGIMVGDDWAYNKSPFMSPNQFREFILPHFSKAVQLIKDAGGYVVKHTDGNIWPILDMVVDTGLHGINPIQPDAGMNLGEVKQKYGDRVCLIGNIDCGHTLSVAPVEQVVAEVKEAIRVAGPGGGYILMSSNSLHSSVKAENYKALVDTARACGEYPL